MAIALITSPTSPDAAYRDGAGIFTYKNELSVTGTADSAGALQLTVTGIGALVSVGDYVYYDQLVGVDDVDSPVAQILAEATNTITLDVDYDASYSGGVVRLMQAEEFEVLTGYTGTAAQPRRTSQVLSVRADPDGIYRVGAALAARSRFNFGEPDLATDSDYHHQVSCVAYPTAISAPSDIILLKQRSGTGAYAPIAYSNFRGLISEVDTHAAATPYKVYQESDKETTLVEGASPVTLRYFKGQTIDILLDSPQTATDMTVTPGFPTGMNWISAVGTYTGIRISPNATAATTTLTLDNTVTGDQWQVVIKLHNSLTVREQCESKELTLVWWHPDGGWWTYSFELLKTYRVDGNRATIMKDAGGVRSAVAFEDIVEAIDLLARPENETILDALNTLNYATQVYIANFTGSGGARAIDMSAFEPCMVEGGAFDLKSVDPYKANDNRFAITVMKGEEIKAINQ